MTTNVPQPTFGATGFQAPAESAILAGVLADINAAFGGNLNMALNTPQGQLGSSLTAYLGYINDLFLLLTNQLDPAYAFGRYQDALARIYFIERNPSQPTVVQSVCTGLAGVVIPVNAKAQAADGNYYIATETGTIGSDGTVTLPFACTLPGPISCPAGTLNQIYQAIPGWDTINNPSDGALGTNTESRSAFEARRSLSVAQNSVGALPSILGAVLSVPDVIDAFVTENDAPTQATVGGVLLAPNSIYVCVLGGDATAVATAIWTRKAPGCAYNGNTTVQIEDTSAGYVPPYPIYSVSFEIPTDLSIFFNVTIYDSTLVPADAATQIQNAIVSAFAGLDGGPRAKIGTEVLASRYYAPIASLGSWAQIVTLEIGCINVPSAILTGATASNVLTVSAVTAGALAANQIITDSTGDLVVGTLVTGQTSGTAGSTGTYTISNAQTVGSEAMTAIVANQFKLPVNINQVPVTSAANITVSIAS